MKYIGKRALIIRSTLTSLVLLSGIASGVILTQTSKDIRNQAYEGKMGQDNRVLGVSVNAVSGQSAIVKWDSNGSTSGLVEYGTNKQKLSRQEIQPGQTYIELQNLLPDQRYYIRVSFYWGDKGQAQEYQFFTKKI